VRRATSAARPTRYERGRGHLMFALNEFEEDDENEDEDEDDPSFY
jgi:hypothetical protein